VKIVKSYGGGKTERYYEYYPQQVRERNYLCKSSDDFGKMSKLLAKKFVL
jgi:hypothetical protein